MKVVSLLPGIDKVEDPEHFKIGANNTLLPGDPTLNPWEKNHGIRFYGVDSGDIHKQHWEGPVPPYVGHAVWNTNRFKKINLNHAAADFYLLEAIASMSFMNDVLPSPQIKTYASRHNLWKLWQNYGADVIPTNREDAEPIAIQAAVMLEQMSITLAPHLSDYLFYACGGELGYHPGTWFLGIHGNQNISFWYMVEMVGPEVVAGWMKEMYTERIKHKPNAGHWEYPNKKDLHQKYWVKAKKEWTNAWGGGSFGGEAWGNCAAVLEMYHRGTVGKMKFDHRQFLDRCFNLQHNTGSALNKCDWKKGNFSVLSTILNAHGESDWKLLYHHASPNVRFMVEKYLASVNRLREVSGLMPVDENMEFFMPTWYAEKVASQTGICKTSGKKIQKGDYVLTHKKGVSLYHEYEAQCSKYGVDYFAFQHRNPSNPNGDKK